MSNIQPAARAEQDEVDPHYQEHQKEHPRHSMMVYTIHNVMLPILIAA